MPEISITYFSGDKLVSLRTEVAHDGAGSPLGRFIVVEGDRQSFRQYPLKEDYKVDALVSLESALRPLADAGVSLDDFVEALEKGIVKFGLSTGNSGSSMLDNDYKPIVRDGMLGEDGLDRPINRDGILEE